MKTVELNWMRATKIWWYYIWRAILISAAANFFIGQIAGAFFVDTTDSTQPTLVRILSLVVGAAIGIVIFKAMPHKQFSDFQVVLQERENMYIWHDESESTVKTRNDLQPFVDELLANKSGSIRLSRGQGEYPMVEALISDKFGYVLFGQTDGVAPYVATGMTPDECPDPVQFKWGGQATYYNLYIPKSSVIRATVACDALFEFLENQNLPKSIKWVQRNAMSPAFDPKRRASL